MEKTQRKRSNYKTGMQRAAAEAREALQQRGDGKTNTSKSLQMSGQLDIRPACAPAASRFDLLSSDLDFQDCLLQPEHALLSFMLHIFNMPQLLGEDIPGKITVC